MSVQQDALTSARPAGLSTKPHEHHQTGSSFTIELPIRTAPQPERGREVLSETLLDASPTRQRFSGRRVLYSTVIHTLVLLALILPPLYFTDTINLKQFTQTLLVAPPPPPPPPPPQAIAKAVVPKRAFMNSGKLMAPTTIPQKIAILKEESLEPDILIGVAGGVPGGVPGGQLGGVIGGIISDAPRKTSVAPPAAQNRAPMRVGGRVRPPRLITKIAPAYPPLARQTRLQGDVMIDAVIDNGGNVVEVQVVSGHPLLLSAALEAVRKWKYEPTYLNDEPISVELVATVTFRLEHQ